MDTSTFAPLTAIVTTYPAASLVAGLALALFVFTVTGLTATAALSGLMAMSGLYWQTAIVLALAVLAWLVHARFYPEVDCRVCSGAGRFRTQFLGRSTSRPCWCCRGSGRHERLGHRVLDRVTGAR